jgi:hypothetical protein
MPTPTPSQLKPPQRPEPTPQDNALRAVHMLLSLPRLVRLIITGVFAFAVTLGLTPIIDYIYLSYIYSDTTEFERAFHASAPAFIEISLGLLMYVLGWFILIGTRGETPPARPAVLWYFGIGTFAVILIFLWLIQGMSSSSTL